MTGAGARVLSPASGCFWTRRFRWPTPAMPMRGATTFTTARCWSMTSRCCSPRNSRAIAAIPRRRTRCFWCNNGLHVELVFDRTHPIGSRDQAGLADVQMESAVSAIMDCEDSVACVDAEDKVQAYANWLGLMQGDLAADVEKGGRVTRRALNPDRTFTAPDGGVLTVKGRALMLVRNVGHLMTNPAILDRDGNEVFEGLMDAAITTLIAMHDLKTARPAIPSPGRSMW